MAQVSFIQIRQIGINIHIAIKIDETILGTVISLMEIKEHFLRQSRNLLWITARFKTVRRIREKGLVHLIFFYGIRGRIDPFHFIVDDAVIDKLARFIEFIVPAFLTKREGVFIGIGIKDSIKIHID